MLAFFLLIAITAASHVLSAGNTVRCVQTEWTCTADGTMASSRYGLPAVFKTNAKVSEAASSDRNPRLEYRSVFIAAETMLEEARWSYVIGIGTEVWTGIQLTEILGHTTFIGVIANATNTQALRTRYPDRKWLSADRRSFAIDTTADQLECEVLIVVGNQLETLAEPDTLFELLFSPTSILSYRKLILQFTPRVGSTAFPSFYWQWTRQELSAYIKTKYNVTSGGRAENNWLILNGPVTGTVDKKVVEESYQILGTPLARPIGGINTGL
jgi:hypothetical protein